jgi:hypothetical protein
MHSHLRSLQAGAPVPMSVSTVESEMAELCT